MSRCRLPIADCRFEIILMVMVSLAVVCPKAFRGATFPAHHSRQDQSLETTISAAEALALERGVLIRWRTSFELDNIGFNVYRMQSSQRIRMNREIIGGSVFIVGQNVPLRAGYSYSFFDREGSSTSSYYVEALGLNGSINSSRQITCTVKGRTAFEGEVMVSSDHQQTTASQIGYISGIQTSIAEGQIEDQWAVASQFGLKISVRKDGWYRVTQQQMTASGFDPAVDISTLQLFNNGRELAIVTSKTTGPLTNGDYIEFYGQAIDTGTSGTNTYYLLAANSPGKRIFTGGKRTNQVRPEDTATIIPSTAGSLPQLELNSQSWFWWLPIFSNNPATNERTAIDTEPRISGSSRDRDELPEAQERDFLSIAPAGFGLPPRGAVESPVEGVVYRRLRESPDLRLRADAVGIRTAKKSVHRATKKRRFKHEYAHPSRSVSVAVEPSFDLTVQKKDRSVYFVALLNGNSENFFGSVISSSAVVQTLVVLNPERTANTTALLQIALQGASNANHVITVQFNDTTIGTMSFTGLERKVQSFILPTSELREGNNNIRLIPASGSGLMLVDFTRLSYPHSYRADDGSLRFTARPGQRLRIGGFSSPATRVIDYTDPLAVRLMKPLVELDGSGYTLQLSVGTSQSSAPRLLYAFPESEVDQSATLSLNQPSSLNLNTNGADLLIISHKSLIPSFTPLVNLRSSQGLTVSLVDVEDIYDEFSYGAHGPQAIRDFLEFVSTHWSKVPRYVILGGDASYDPRNYLGFGERDFVPTKLVDATFNETSSDDWLTDFDNDGIADIPVGRIPASTAAQANIIISKLISFAPANVPQSALLVADAQRTYYFNFEQANSQVQALLPASMIVERVDRRTQPSDAQASTAIISKINSGQALINYSGHGNVNTWTDGSIFTSDLAFSLTNGNKLPFVVVMDCLNGYFHEPNPTFSGLAEAFLQAPNGGALASFASSGLTIPDGQHAMSLELYAILYGSQTMALGDAIKIAKASTNDIDVRRTWIFFGDPSMKIR